MIERITIFCFAASYAVALLLEVTRLLFRSGIRGAVMLGFAVAGIVAHTLYLGYQGYTDTLNNIAPLSSPAEYYLLASWLLAVLYLHITWTQPRVAVGIFLLPLILLLIGVAKMANTEPFSKEKAAIIWGYVHGAFLLVGYVAVVYGFVMGVMYLIHASRLKSKMPPTQRFRLPPLEWLERANHRATVLAAIWICFGFISGIILKLAKFENIPWTDPVIWRSGVMVIWLVAAAVFSSFYKPAQRGRKVAYLTVASFAFLVLSIAASFAFDSQHRNQDKSNGEKAIAHAYANRVAGVEVATATEPPANFTLRFLVWRFAALSPSHTTSDIYVPSSEVQP
jgi:ABC-type uncharacterized transport system permease subunit